MPWLAATLLLLVPDPFILLNAYAASRSVEQLKSISSPAVAGDPKAFSWIKTGGVYGTGRKGWKVQRLVDFDGKKTYAVFTSRINAEDMGEPVYLFENGKLTRKIEESDGWGFTIRHHTFDIRFQPSKKNFAIRDTIRLERSVGSGSTAMIRMQDNYLVSGVTDAKGKPVAFRQISGVTIFKAPAAAKSEVTITYSGGSQVLTRDSDKVITEAILSGDFWYPMIARGAVTSMATVRVPKDWKAICHGNLVAQTVDGKESVWKYQMDVPTSILSLCTGKYRIETLESDGIKFQVAAVAMPMESMRLQNELNVPIFRKFSQWAKYPFKQWTTLITQLPFDGALEAYSFATYGEGWLPDQDPHETGHTWFGGILPNTYLKSLWNESFASFCEGYFLREGTNGNRAIARLGFVRPPEPSGAFQLNPPYTAGGDTGMSAYPIGYEKGAHVLQMLEQELGVATFDRAVQQAFKNHKPGTTTEWSDIERAVAEASGKDFKWFFDQWLRRTGYPEFAISNPTYNDGNVTAQVEFKGEPYRMRMDALLIMPDGTETLTAIDLIPEPGAKTAAISIPTLAKPAKVSLDPYHRLLRGTTGEVDPITLRNQMKSKVWVHPNSLDLAEHVIGSGAKASSNPLPKDLEGYTIVAKPADVSEVASLLAKVGVRANGKLWQWGSRSIDLSKQSFSAVIDLGEGKSCVVITGSARHRPSFGQCRLVLSDDLGQFIDGAVDPLRAGPLVMAIP